MSVNWLNQQQDYIYFLYVFALLFLVTICRKVYKGNIEYEEWRYFYFFLLLLSGKYFLLLIKQVFGMKEFIQSIILLVGVAAYAYLIVFIKVKRLDGLNKTILSLYLALTLSLYIVYILTNESRYLLLIFIIQAIIGFLAAVSIVRMLSDLNIKNFYIYTGLALFIESIHRILEFFVDEKVYVNLFILLILFVQLFASRVRFFYVSKRLKNTAQSNAIIIDTLLAFLLIIGFIFINMTENISKNLDEHASPILFLNDITSKLRGTGIILILILALVIMVLAQYYQRIQEEQQRAFQYLSLAGAFIVLIGREGNIRLINKKGCTILGSEEKDVIGKNWFDNFIPTSQIDTMKKVFNQIVNGQIAPVEFYENEIITAKKEIRLIKWTNTTVEDDNGRMIGVLSSGEDVTEIKQMEQSLRRAKSEAEAANVAKSRFLANMSHEIRTPINAIMGFAQLLLQAEMDFRHKDYVAKIRVASKTLLSIINDILDFSKIESGKVELESIPFIMDDILIQISDLFSFDASEKQIELIFDIDNEISTYLIGDSLRLGQVLVNLVGNAIKFTEKGQVILRVRKKKSEKSGILLLEFSVIDTGIGISEDKLNTLFQPFHQADSSTTRKYGGTGLGLSICHSLVHLMGGRIRVDSRLGVGSTFSFSIALGIGQILDDSRVLEALGGFRALIVEDNPLVAEILTSMLNSYGILTETIVSEADYKRFIEDVNNKNQRFDIVIAKCKNSDMNEQNDINIINDIELLANVPKILTAMEFDSDELWQKAKSMSIDHVITKPIIGKDLIKVVGELLYQKTSLNEIYKTVVNEAINNEAIMEGDTMIQVLLVEDNRMNRLLMVEMLLSLGLEVDAAVNGKEALSMLDADSNKYDIVFMDIQMPVMNGLEAAQKIRSEAKFKGLPIIAMSADIAAEDRRRSIHSGMNEHINKPVDIEILRSVLKRFVLKKKLADIEDKEESLNQNEKQLDIINKINNIKVEGFDVEKGLRKLNFNIELYKELLKTFSKQFKDSCYKLENLLKQKDLQKMGGIIHEVKGVSGNLCINAIFDLFSQMDIHVKNGNFKEIESCMKEIKTNMESLLNSFSYIREQLPDNIKKPVVIPENNQIGDHIHKLKDSLKLNSFEAEHELDYLMAILSETEYKKDIIRIKEYIDLLNFDLALDSVGVLEQKLR